MKKVVFLKNAAILTVTSIILRMAGIFFKVWLASAIGAEGIGLYQLIFSVYLLFSTFSSSGTVTAVTRLIADELALGSQKGVKKILLRCIGVTLILAVVSGVLLFFSAGAISKYFLRDLRAIPALEILSFSLPFLGTTAVFRGYFIARRKASPSAFSQLLEQAVRITVVLTVLKNFADKDLKTATAGIVFSDVLAHLLVTVVLWLLYLKDSGKLKKLNGRENPPFSVLKAVLHISAPITAGRYLNTALRTVENSLVPTGLSRYGGNKNGLSLFGMIKGMALPILFFPSSVLGSFSTLLIPEISRSLALGRMAPVKLASERIIQVTSISSFIFAAIFFNCGYEIADLIYKDRNVGFLLCVLSPIVPLMYLDSVCDGILKGLDCQQFVFRSSICDSVMRIVLILAILPSTGLGGFIGIMYISNFLTAFLNVGHLLKVSGGKLKVTNWILIPLVSSAVIMSAVTKILKFFNLSNLVYIILACGIGLPLYLGIVFAFKCITRADIEDLM